MGVPKITPTERLPNGAMVIDLCRMSGPEQRWVVLCIQQKGQSHEFVTWEIDSETLDAYWGHYHGSNLIEAVQELGRRSQAYKLEMSEYTDTEANKIGG